MDIVADWMSGRLSAEERIWTALAPALLMCAYWIGGFIIFSILHVVRGPYQDAEMTKRGSTPLSGMYFRQFFAWIIQPLWRGTMRTGIPPSAITTLSVLLSTASGVALGVGRFALGGWLYIFAGILDVLDGRVARARGIDSRKGAALDSVLDRYSDSAVLVGLSWYYRDSWVLLAAQLALVGSSIVPYIRAKGEASGVSMKEVGIMQRAERIIYLGCAVALSPILEVWLDPNAAHPVHRLAIVGVVLLAVSTQITALQRLVALLGALDESPPKPMGKSLLVRSVVAAGFATLADALLFDGLVLAGMPAPAATSLGCILGASLNYTINRIWTFHNTDAKLPQAGRYAFVSITSMLLNVGGVAVLMLVPAVNHRIAWMLVRTAVYVAWNFPLQRDYVFAARGLPAKPRQSAA